MYTVSWMIYSWFYHNSKKVLVIYHDGFVNILFLQILSDVSLLPVDILIIKYLISTKLMKIK